MNDNRRIVGLQEHLGTGNLGDEATVDAVLQQIRLRWPDTTIVAISLNPLDTEVRHGIPSYPLRRIQASAEWWLNDSERSEHRPSQAPASPSLRAFIKDCLAKLGLLSPARGLADLIREAAFVAKSYRVAKTLDILVVSGGGQLLDTWGPWGFPYTLFKWVWLARLAGARCYFINVGAGPLKTALGKWFVRRALSGADYLSFRDGRSLRLIEDIGGRCGGAKVKADNVYGLSLSSLSIAQSGIRNASSLVVGISPMAYCDPGRFWTRDADNYERYIRELAEFGAHLVRQGHRIQIFSSDIWFDAQAIIDLQGAIRKRVTDERADWVIAERVTGIDAFMTELSRVDCILTCRFHGVVFAHLLNVPVLALAHHQKISTLMRDFDLGDYCLDIDTFSAPLLIRTLDRLLSNAQEVQTHVAQRVRLYREELAQQFDQLFAPGGGARTTNINENTGAQRDKERATIG